MRPTRQRGMLQKTRQIGVGVVLSHYCFEPEKHALVGYRAIFQLGEWRGKLGQEALQHRLVKRFLVLEMVVQAGRANAHTVCDITERCGAITLLRKQILRCIENAIRRGQLSILGDSLICHGRDACPVRAQMIN